MRSRNEYLIHVAHQFINNCEPEVVYASVGGSVGRGEADRYSDVDVTVFTKTAVTSKNIDLYYEKEIIQAEVLPATQLPTKQAIREEPWNYRFITETMIIKDTDGIYQALREWAICYLNSVQAKQKMIQFVSAVVKERCTYAVECIHNHMTISANITAMGAMADAGFLYLFIRKQSCSTEAMFSEVIHNHKETFMKASPFSLSQDHNISACLRHFRQFLRKQGYNSNQLTDIHDVLCDKKIERLNHANHILQLQWQMYGEAVGLYLETANGLPYEDFQKELPLSLQKELTMLGFSPFSMTQVEQLCSVSQELIKKATRTYQ
ncbi:nucleotidyltransferase domain-containing protein [Gracilibacillus salinarum]|uniref:Nucleotidyltransferase domain-containing protein n=1 Tax=Gracilibacillus salinarum TaxID=2932255 RepID=A0ABY4GU11_9BACI|nr:nucleotidyltransferase domain-containing protein [Gracilibacillus salinarum]UOQ87167.1 nucleotidyltransferase domain-containing protein [Gracilibacillus salinarum]